MTRSRSPWRAVPGGKRGARNGNERQRASASRTDDRTGGGGVPVYEAEVAEGLEAIARDELRRRLGGWARVGTPRVNRSGTAAIRLAFDGDPRELLAPRTVLAVYLVRAFAVPRPRALLGDEHCRALLAAIEAVRGLHPRDAFATFHLSAAGAESAVLTRLKEELARRTGLRAVAAADEGDLALRLRRPPDRGAGWEALVRLSPRPLATRPWRVCNLEGALNATVAHAMALLTQPDPRDVFLNLACGSGTLLIERLAHGPARRAIGCDTSPEALACARANVAASGYGDAIELAPWDARALPLPEASVDALATDLPFGQLVGSHTENLALYPAVLREAARVARGGAPFALITHEVRLMESLLARSAEWAVDDAPRVNLGGLHPRIFVLRRR